MRTRMLRAIISAGIATMVVMVTGPGASAAVDTNRKPQILVGVGSDNIYEVMNDLDQLYNESPGCAIIPSTGVTFTNYGQQCLVPGQLDYASLYTDLIQSENLYHDMVTEAKPVGSGNGTTVLTKYLTADPAATLQADFNRRSSNTTTTTIGTAPYNYNLYETQFAKAGMGIWTGSTNAVVADPPVYLKTDLLDVWEPDAITGCLVNFASGTTDSIGPGRALPADFLDSNTDGIADDNTGNMVPYSVQSGSGTGNQFDQFLKGTTSGGAAANTWGCIPQQFKNAIFGDGEHVIFENNPAGVCDNKNPNGTAHSDQADAIYPYAFHRFVQNKGGALTAPCQGKLGRLDANAAGVAPAPVVANVNTITNGKYVYSASSYLYFPVPVCKDINNAGTPGNTTDDTCDQTYTAAGFALNTPSTWDVLPDKSEAVLEYIHPVYGWLCKPSGSHAIDPISGKNYRTLLETVLKVDGFGQFAAASVGGTGTFSGTSNCRSSN